MSQSKVLVIEDDGDLANLIQLNLRDINFDVTTVHNGNEGLALAMTQSYALIVLDLMLPGKDGLSICQALREKDIRTPILMLTARNTETDRVVGLEIGADDYLTKPFSIRELQARIKAIIRRIEALTKESKRPDNNAKLSFHQVEIDVEQRQVDVDGQRKELTATEFDLLLFMAKQPGRVFSRPQLLDAVWGYQHSGYEHTVNSHINRLRVKLEDDPGNPKLVQTVWGVGYKFADSA